MATATRRQRGHRQSLRELVSLWGGLLAFAAVLAVWQVSGAVRACMGALARVYDADDDRPWWIRFPVSIGIATVVTAALVAAVLLALLGHGAVHGGWGAPFALGRWLATLVLIAVAFGVLVRFGPVEPRTKRWASGGAAIVVAGWTVQSLLFGWYLRSLADYRTATGSLLAVYFLTTYLYVAAIVLLVGIELDELLRKDLQGEQERGILELVRGVL